jgi:orotidine-5'-phosphate decarboxylase
MVFEGGGPVSESAGSAVPFGDRLSSAVAERSSQIFLGLDPEPAKLWPEAIEGATGSDAIELSASAVALHCSAVINAAGPHCVGVKFQLASFERLGTPGREALDVATAAAKAEGLIVLADGKRGDIGISASSYAAGIVGTTQTPWGEVEGLGADALTVNPLLGAETLEPFVDAARPLGRGLFVLVRTSNPGAGDIQDQILADGGTVSDRLATIVAGLGQQGPASGLADVGAVVGATAPGHLEQLRELMPHAPILLPGVGAQGGRVEDLAPAFLPGPAGGLITVSRSIVHAERADELGPAGAAAAAASELRDLAWRLSGA